MIVCPTCHKPFDPDANKTAVPFCSERCRLVDLGRWIDERHGMQVVHGGTETVEPPAEEP